MEDVDRKTFFSFSFVQLFISLKIILFTCERHVALTNFFFLLSFTKRITLKKPIKKKKKNKSFKMK